MNFLQLIASGASILNFNFQSITSPSIEPIPKLLQKPSGFKKVTPLDNPQSAVQLPNHAPHDQTHLLKQILQNQRKDLINRYLQLNLQLLEGNVSIPESKIICSTPLKLNDQVDEKESLEPHEKLSNSKKKIKKPVKCGHDDKAHYAKGMCNNCYHKYGRTKKPWNCPHQRLYAAGMCQNCYINSYNKKKRDQLQFPDEKAQNLQNMKQNMVNFDEQNEQKKTDY